MILKYLCMYYELFVLLQIQKRDTFNNIKVDLRRQITFLQVYNDLMALMFFLIRIKIFKSFFKECLSSGCGPTCYTLGHGFNSDPRQFFV